ncbi:MAG: hypothetical protein H0T11_08465 [Chthoniobacterales bacterium]|nr:hypothetical protein [Chthoniobacterales bacterium]
MGALLFATVLFVAGYTLVLVEDRYIWIARLVLIIGAFDALQVSRKVGRLSPRAASVLSIILGASFALAPIGWFYDNAGVDRGYYEAARQLPSIAGSRIAGNSMTVSYFAYYGEATFFGILRGSQEHIERQLADSAVDYYFLLGDAPEPAFVRGHLRVDSGAIESVRLYRLTPP